MLNNVVKNKKYAVYAFVSYILYNFAHKMYLSYEEMYTKWLRKR